MKRLYLILLLFVVTLSASAQTIGEAFYIYRNDGQFNAFFRDEVDSIAYSHYDVDSVYYDENVTQLVYTADSLYRIPLAAIDSVAFVAPPTVYKEDVTRLEYNLLDYIIGTDGLTLKLKLETPTQIVPNKGDKLVLLDGCDALPYGFSGIVTSVQVGSSSIDVICEQAYLEDLFDSFCSVSSVYGANQDEEDAARGFWDSSRHRVIYDPDDFVFSLGPFKINQSYEVSQGIAFNGDLALTGGASYSVEVQPTFRIQTFLILGEGQGTYFSYSITGDLRVTSQTSLYGGLSYNHDFDGVVASCPIPETANMVNFYINPGLFVRADATITSSITSTQIYTFGSAFDFSSKGLNTVKPSIGGRLASSSVDMIGSLDGSLAGGAYVEIGFNVLSREIARVCVRGEMGARFSGSFVLRNSDIDNASKETKLYERLKASEVELASFVNVSLQASVAHTGNGLTLELSEPIHRWNLVPEFSNTKLTQTAGSKTSADASTELRGDCLFPVGVGYKLFDKNKNEVENYDAGTSYTNRASIMKHTFAGLGEEKYKVYPKVRLFDRYDVLASPSAELNMRFPVTLSDFKVTKSQYKQNGFTHEGVAYDYRFDVSVNATLDDDAENIADWGYVYLDPNGREAFISLKQFGRSYTDTRWAYFRNDPKSTCTLYGYVKYVGSDEPVYGEPQDFPLEYGETTCPDANHPHMIDLGLPSGTQWACCNVGASTPEGYGNYYAWGETQPKSVYDWSTYRWGSDYDELRKYCTKSSCGSVDNKTTLDSSDDAATANWGAPWRMPSLTQIQELLNSCTSTWTAQNGVYGRKFVGPNGGAIFLPAAGYRWNGELCNAGSGGYYWSSTLNEGGPYDAFSLYFDSSGAYWSYVYRLYGHTVRPVR